MTNNTDELLLPFLRLTRGLRFRRRWRSRVFWWKRRQQGEDGGSKVLRNVGILTHYYRASQPKRYRLGSWIWCSIVKLFSSYSVYALDCTSDVTCPRVCMLQVSGCHDRPTTLSAGLWTRSLSTAELQLQQVCIERNVFADNAGW